MAVAILSRILGSEDESPGEAAASPEAPIGADPFAIAMAVDQARQDPSVAAAIRSVLQKQARLIDNQIDQLEQESALRLASLHSQYREGRIRRVGLHIRIGMQVFTALAATCIAIGLLIMLADAFRSHAVIVEAFDTPPALAASGFSGKVVATGVLDGLQKLADATRGTDKALDTRDSWSSDVQIQVPATGIAIGEIARLLHARFGRDLHITGDLVQAAGGLALTVRGDGVTPRTFHGGAGELPLLTTQAAEYIYGRSQPAKFVTYLINNGRNGDALAFLPGAFTRAGTDAVRSVFANAWGNALMGLNRPAQAAAKYSLAIALDPANWAARTNLPAAVVLTDGEEAAWHASVDLLQAAAHPPAGMRPDTRLLVNAAQFTWDLPLDLKAELADAAHNDGAGSAANPDGPQIADIYALMHDPASASRYLDSSDPADPLTKAETLLLQAYAALNRNDPQAAIPPMQAFWRAWQADPNLQTSYNDQHCFLGLALGLAGRMPEAAAFFQEAGSWNRCFAFRGDVLAQAGDIAGAQRSWAEGQRLGPDLPNVYLHRGLFEAGRHDFAAAIADYAAAAKAAPHYADPLKAWGDALAGEGDWQQAEAKYADALRYAPHWDALGRAQDIAEGHAANR